jgi:hypothetical protein
VLDDRDPVGRLPDDSCETVDAAGLRHRSESAPDGEWARENHGGDVDFISLPSAIQSEESRKVKGHEARADT